MKEKIEEIVNKKLAYCPEVREADIYRVHRIRVEELKGEISTLIQEERKKDREMIYKDIQANYHITADEFYKHYLQSLDKGDTDENR